VALGLEQALKIVVSAVDNASGVLNGIRGIVQGLSSDALTTAQTLDTIGSGLQQTGRSMTRYVTAPVVGAYGLAAKSAMDFEEQLTIVGVAANRQGEDLEYLGDAALAMGEDLRLVGEFNATDSLVAMEALYKAGKSDTEIFGDLNAYMEGTAELGGIMAAGVLLAAASELDLQQATEALLVSLNTYGLGAEDAMDVANMLVQTADASVASVSDLVGSLSTAGPVLANFGQSYEESLTQIAILSERGIKGPEAGTNLRSMYNNMFRETNRSIEALEALGIERFDAEGNFRPMVEVIDELNEGMSALTDKDLFRSLKDLFGNYGQLAGVTLGTEGAGGYVEMQDKIAKASTVQEVAAARSQTFAAQIEKLQGSLQTFMITAGTPFIEDFLQPAVEHLQSFVDKLNDLNPETLDFAIRIGMISAVMGPALIALGTLARALASILTLYKLIAGAQTAAGLAGAGGAAAGAAGLGAAGTGLAALPALGAVPVVGAAAYATANPAETEKALVGSRDWLRGLIGLPEYDPSLKPWEQLWWNAPKDTGEPSPEVQSMLATPLPGQTDYAGAVRDEYLTAMTNAAESEASLSAESWVTEFEATMTAYDSTMESIGLGGGTALKAGFMYAAEDAGSEFLLSIARQLAPELVPYVMEAMAARNATLGPVG